MGFHSFASNQSQNCYNVFRLIFDASAGIKSEGSHSNYWTQLNTSFWRWVLYHIKAHRKQLHDSLIWCNEIFKRVSYNFGELSRNHENECINVTHKLITDWFPTTLSPGEFECEWNLSMAIRAIRKKFVKFYRESSSYDWHL